jgi:hypothetical protein
MPSLTEQEAVSFGKHRSCKGFLLSGGAITEAQKPSFSTNSAESAMVVALKSNTMLYLNFQQIQVETMVRTGIWLACTGLEVDLGLQLMQKW